MTVLVTGAGGFLGGHLVDLLVERGERVRILARPADDFSRVAQVKAEVCRGDLADRASLEAAVDGVDRVLNCAARTGPWGPEAAYRTANVGGPENLLQAAMAAGVRRFVHVSSIAVHGTDIRGSADETAPLRGGPDPYSRTKAAGERILLELLESRGAPMTIVRPGLIYGPGDRNSFARFAGLIERGRMPIIGSGRNHVPLIYVRDVARGIVAASEADQAVGKAYLLVNDAPVTQREYFAAIARELDVAPPRLHLPYRLALAVGAAAEAAGHLARMERPPPVMRFGLQQIGGENRFLADRARTDFGFSPQVSLADGVRASVAWYRTLASRQPSSLQGSVQWTS
jgi:nucleoside-diphosphate-sugar epimerase